MLAAAPTALLAALGAVEERRAKATVTIVGDHLYLERAGESFDGPILRGAMG